MGAGLEAETHQVTACCMLIGQDRGINRLRARSCRWRWASKCRALVAHGRAVAKRHEAAPAALDPAHQHGRGRPFAENAPDSAAEAPQNNIFTPPEHPLRKDEQALALVKHFDRLVYLRSLPAKVSDRYSDGVDHVGHQPVQHGEIEEHARHQREHVPGHELGDPERVQPGCMIGND